jgi:hypothetical protein
MDQAEKERIQREIEDEVDRLFPGALRRVEWLGHADEPRIGPGEFVPRVVLTVEPSTGRQRGRPGTREAVKAFQKAHRPALRQFGEELTQRWPEIQHLGYEFEDDRGNTQGGMIIALGDQADPARRVETGIVPVMVRLKPAELEIVDTLITAGIAGNRAEAVRWVLARISERPAFARLREHTSEIEKLKTEL